MVRAISNAKAHHICCFPAHANIVKHGYPLHLLLTLLRIVMGIAKNGKTTSKHIPVWDYWWVMQVDPSSANEINAKLQLLRKWLKSYACQNNGWTALHPYSLGNCVLFIV